MTTNIYDHAGTLMQQTSTLLKARAPKESDLARVSVETDLPFFWLRRYWQGGFKNPSVNRIQYLYEHLSGSKLIQVK